MVKQPSLLSLLLAALGLIYMVALFNHGPIPSMEPRFAEAVREMLARGEYLIPIKNGVPYIEYPVFYYWLSIGAKFLGLPLLAAVRLPAYVGLLLWICWLMRLQRVLLPDWQWPILPITGAALPGILYNFFTAQSDSLLMLGTLVAITGFARFRLRQPTHGFPWELWLGVTLATAAKGPVGIAITLPVMGLEILLDVILKQGIGTNALLAAWRELWRISWIRGLGLLLLINLPWYLAAGLTHGWDLVRAIVVYQNFTRFLVGFDHSQPWWLYAQTIWGDLFPLAFLLPFGIVLGAKRLHQFPLRLSLAWAGFTILFFSISASKQSKYILPAAPAMVLLSLYVVTLLPEKIAHRSFKGLMLWAATLILAFGGLVFFWLPRHQGDIGGQANFAKIRAVVNAHPGQVISYQWPRSLTLYELGAPMHFVRSSRQLYAEIAAGKISAGDYILVNNKYLPGGGQPESVTLTPPPAVPRFDKVITVNTEDHMTLFRVTPQAAKLPVPATPQPPPRYWWDIFDTD